MKASGDFPKLEFDQKAETTAELASVWPMGEKTLRRFIRTKLANGEWEQVFKKVNGKAFKAYRRAAT